MRKLLLYVCPLLLISSAAWATPMCVDGNTLAQYISQGGCTFGGFTFSMFNFSDSGSVPLLPTAVTDLLNPWHGLYVIGLRLERLPAAWRSVGVAVRAGVETTDLR